MNKKINQNLRVCPRFEKCSINICPLDLECKIRVFIPEEESCPFTIKKRSKDKKGMITVISRDVLKVIPKSNLKMLNKTNLKRL